MRHILMMKGARTLVETCAALRPDESVLIVTDMEMMEVAEPVAAAAFERGAETVLTVMPPRTADGQEPPLTVAAAMTQADVVFTPVSVSITHTRAVAEAVAAGARGLMLTGFTPELLISGGIEADFVAQKPICEGLAARFAKAHVVHLTSSGGTDLTMSAAGRRGNALTGIVEPGRFSTVPTIEANFSPVEGSAQGTIIADASIPYIGIGLLRQPVRATVENGFITHMDGGQQANRLEAALREANDPNVYNIAELGVGLNPKCRMQGIMLEDEGVLGTVHIGIGTNITLGGHVKAALHYDLIMWEPTIALDGEVVLERGQLRI